MGVRLVRKTLNLDSFPKIPGAYRIRGSYKQIVGMERAGVGRVVLFLLEDPGIQKDFDERHAKWVKAKAAWDADPRPPGFSGTGKGEFSKTEPALDGPVLVVMREGADQPLWEDSACDLILLGSEVCPDGHLYFLTPPKPMDPISAFFGDTFGF